MAKRLEYEIGVDASKGVGGLKQFSAAVKKAMADVEGSVADTATQADKVSQAFVEMAGKIETEMKQAADAAEALGKALGPEVADRADLDSITRDLNQMGLSFEEITRDADKLAVGLRELDRVGQAGLGTSLPASTGRVKAGLDDVRNSADQSRSVLANMVGNSVQDLGALGGVAGSTGVLIGQLGEYAADGNIKLSALAKLGLPMAGIAAGIALVNQHLASMARTEAFNKQRVVDFTEAMEDATVTAQELQDVLAAEEDPNSIIANIGSDMVDVEDSVASVLGTFDEFRRIVRGGEDALTDWITDQLAMASAAGATEDELKDLNDALLTGLTTNKVNAEVGRAVAAGYKDQVNTAYALGQAIRQQGDASDEAARDNAFYGDSIRDAKEASDAAAASIPGLGRVFTDLSADAIQAAQDAKEVAVSLAEAQLELNDMATSFSEMERREGAIQAAFDLGDAPFETAKNISDINVAVEDLAAFLRENPFDSIDFGPGPQDFDAAPFLSKVDALKGPIQQKLSNAFVTGGEEAARLTAQELISSIVGGLDGALTAEQVDQLLFGPGGHTAVIDIAVDQTSLAKAQAMIQLVAGLPGADPLWVAQVQLDLQADKITPQAAQVLAAQAAGELGLNVDMALLPPSGSELSQAKRDADDFYRRNPGVMPLEAGAPRNLAEQHRKAQDALNKAPLVIPVQYKITDRNPLRLDSGGTANGAGGLAGEVGPEIAQFPGSGRRVLLTEPTYVPPGTRVTSQAPDVTDPAER